jgi:hypothetical protein
MVIVVMVKWMRMRERFMAFTDDPNEKEYVSSTCLLIVTLGVMRRGSENLLIVRGPSRCIVVRIHRVSRPLRKTLFTWRLYTAPSTLSDPPRLPCRSHCSPAYVHRARAAHEFGAGWWPHTPCLGQLPCRPRLEVCSCMLRPR